MKRIAIVGVGPTGIYTFYELVKRGEPLAITLFEKEAQAGVGMPYSDDNTAAQMLANIASIEIPPIDLTYLQWLQQQSDDWLSARGLERHALHERQFLPRVILGEYYRDRFLYLVERSTGWESTVGWRALLQATDGRWQSPPGRQLPGLLHYRCGWRSRWAEPQYP